MSTYVTGSNYINKPAYSAMKSNTGEMEMQSSSTTVYMGQAHQPEYPHQTEAQNLSWFLKSLFTNIGGDTGDQNEVPKNDW